MDTTSNVPIIKSDQDVIFASLQNNSSDDNTRLSGIYDPSSLISRLTLSVGNDAESVDSLKRMLEEERKQKLLLQAKIDKQEEILKKLLAEKRIEASEISLRKSSSVDLTLPSSTLLDNLRNSSLNTNNQPLSDFNVEQATSSSMKERITQLEQMNKEKDSIITSLQEDCKQLSLKEWRTMSEKLKQDVEMEVVRKKYKMLQDEKSILEQLLEDRDEEISVLRKELNLKNEANYKMALKLMDYKSKVSTVDLQLRKYPAKKLYKYWPSVDAELILSKNPGSGSLSMDVVEKGKHNVKPFKSVQLAKDTNTRFYVYYGDGTWDLFESEISTDIVQNLTELTS